MKTIDILNLLGAFNRVYEDPTLTNDEKAAIGNEVLIQLPRASFIPSVGASLNATYRSIEERVTQLEAPSVPTETGRTEGPKEPGKSLRKTKPNA